MGILSRGMNAAFWPPDEATEPRRDDRYDSFEPILAHCDLVIVEGDSQTTAPKIEVWRRSLGTPPLASEDASIAAVVTDDDVDFSRLDLTVPVRLRSDVSVLADAVCELAEA